MADSWELCECFHGRSEHGRKRCMAADSYGIRCECDGFVLDRSCDDDEPDDPNALGPPHALPGVSRHPPLIATSFDRSAQPRSNPCLESSRPPYGRSSAPTTSLSHAEPGTCCPGCWDPSDRRNPMSSRNPEPLAIELADILPQLALADGSTLMLAGFSTEAMKPFRIQYTEALLAWLRANGHMPKPEDAKPARKRPSGGSGQAKAK